jgi:hypothetical protein
MSLPGFTAETAIDVEEAGSDGAMSAKYRISVPGLGSGQIGLGDVIGRTASLVGLTPCGGCQRRARALNSWLVFLPRR